MALQAMTESFLKLPGLPKIAWSWSRMIDFARTKTFNLVENILLALSSSEVHSGTIEAILAFVFLRPVALKILNCFGSPTHLLVGVPARLRFRLCITWVA